MPIIGLADQAPHRQHPLGSTLGVAKRCTSPPPAIPMLEIRTDAASQDAELIHRFLSDESAWARGIPRNLVEESIRNSLNFGLFLQEQQVGFARVVTDYATFAYILDVFVLAEHRGKGFSRQLMAAVMSSPKLQGLRRIVLVSSTARGLYSRFGFSALAKPETYMEINHPNLYSAGDA